VRNYNVYVLYINAYNNAFYKMSTDKKKTEQLTGLFSAFDSHAFEYFRVTEPVE